MITPTVGRIVWYHPAQAETLEHVDQPLAAIITYVWSPYMVNLTVFDMNGHPHPRTSVTLIQPDVPIPLSGAYCEWMPFQKGQAKKTEELEQRLAD